LVWLDVQDEQVWTALQPEQHEQGGRAGQYQIRVLSGSRQPRGQI